MASGTRSPKHAKSKIAKNYRHPESESPMRPEVGTQAQFKKKLPPAKYRYDDSLAPSLEWDGQNPARERGEARIAKAEQELAEAKRKLAASAKPEEIEAAKAHLAAAQEAVRELKAMSKPFLNWAGKAERLSFEVPTLPLFIHERLSTKAILETLKGHKRDKQTDMFDLWGDPQHSIADQVLRAYEHKDKWVNRMILGDSLVVMNSLLRYESLAGQVQMIYMDPPYGVEFRSNFQPFVRSRDVKHNDDEDMTREPEMVQAYRDTWVLRLHSYLTYLRDRLLIARELLHSSGSIFVQIGDANVHHVRELLDEVFGPENFVAVINFKTMMPLESGEIESVYDYLCWYARDKERLKYRNVFIPKVVGEDSEFVFADTSGGNYRRLTPEEISNFSETAQKCAIFKRSDLASSGYTPSCIFPIEFAGQTFVTKRGKSWRTTPEGVEVLKSKYRLFVLGKKLYYKMYLQDFGYRSLTNSWHDTIEFGGRMYVVQTTPTVVERCLLMTTEPGDLVLDPTCGSGTSAYCAEKWGRRWITIDTSRVPLALARQRLLTATYPWYQLKDESRGPAGGFVYERRQNKNNEEAGGIVPHVTLESIANNELPKQEVLVDRPEKEASITRVTGPFCVEATIPTPQDFEEVRPEGAIAPESESRASFIDRMLEVLRKSPVLRLEGNKTVALKNVRPPAKTLSLSAEAMVPNGAEKSVAFVFGPESGAVSEKLVYQAAKEANAKNYSHLYVVGFAIQPNARMLVEQCADVVGIPATYVQATPDLMMGDLLKNMRSSQIFSVCGLPEAEIRKAKKANGAQQYEVELLGLDVFDPVAMEVHHRSAHDVPAWLLDTDYNGMCFHVSQAFFPRTSAWENLKKALKGEYEDTVWDHLAGTVSAPFEAGEQGQVAIKVIDDRGNELLIVKSLSEAK
jgi:adenine-specific DNA-methyltransferase